VGAALFVSASCAFAGSQTHLAVLKSEQRSAKTLAVDERMQMTTNSLFNKLMVLFLVPVLKMQQE